MTQDQIAIQKRATTRVKFLAKTLFVLGFFVGGFGFLGPPYSIAGLAICLGLGLLIWVIAWRLFRTRSYVISLIFAILGGSNFAFMCYLAVLEWSAGRPMFFTLTMSFLFLLITFRAERAAFALKKLRNNDEILPEIFS